MFKNNLADLRFGLRLLWKQPGFTAIAILALALGIGANTAIFSTVDAALLRPLPYLDSDRLAMVWQDGTFVGFPRAAVTPADYLEWKRLNHVFSGMAALRVVSASLTAEGPPEQVEGQATTADFFDVLGVRPLIGRVFTEEEDRGRTQVALIGYGLWQRRYQGDPNMVGRTIPLNNAKYIVIGVLPKGFMFQGRLTDYWVPLSMSPAALADRSGHSLIVVARLKPGATMTQAHEDLHAMARRLQAQGLFDKRSDVIVVPLREDLLGKTRQALLVLIAASGCVLLIACANLANLLLARGVARRREMAVRSALGAGRARLVRQMIVECLLLSLGGGGLGFGLALIAIKALATLVPASMPESAVPAIDLRLLGFTSLLSVITGLIFSIAPALHTTKASLDKSLKQGGRGNSAMSHAMRDALLVAEVASALVLLVCAGLLLRTMANLRSIDVGFRSDHLLTMRAAPARAMEPSARQSYYDLVIARVLALPGVEDAAFVSDLPFQQSGNSRAFQIEGRLPKQNGPVQLALYRTCTSDYLKTLGVKVTEGRLLERSDVESSASVVVITETLAKQFFIGESPLGRRLRIAGLDAGLWGYGPDSPFVTIVGVVADIHERGYDAPMMPGVYLPIAQSPNSHSAPENLVVRTKVDPESLAEPIRKAIFGVNPRQPVARVAAMDKWIDLDIADRRQQTALLGTFAGLALSLASMGLYGVLSYSVTQRSREIGVRMALGASAADVTAMIVRHGLRVTSVGLLVGLPLSWAVTRAIGKLLYGVRATDPATFAAVALVLTATALAASWIPARRASTLDPLQVLRDE